MALATSTVLPTSLSSFSSQLRHSQSRRLVVRAESRRGGLLDKNTKEDVLRESIRESIPQPEMQSPVYSLPRPEVERRPEAGNTSFGSLMAFDGPGPETINGRLAMLGFYWAFAVERITGKTVLEQVYGTGNKGLLLFLIVTQVICFASLVPLFKGESPDSRQVGVWRARAERWNGRLAMVGFLCLLVTEAFTHSPLFHR